MFGAALVAGAVNAVAGGGTLITFPTLLWVGIPPVTANATNSVALWPGLLTAVYGFRREIAVARRHLLALVVPAALGGVAGALALLGTPPGLFEAMAPALVLVATALLALQDRVGGRLDAAAGGRPSGVWWIGGGAAVLLTAAYAGFFGAGFGILLLGILSLLGERDIHEMNGVKNLLSLTAKGVALVSFAIGGIVDWPLAALMAAGALIGGLAGSVLSRRFERRAVRRAVVMVGLAMAASLVVRLVV
ncbi:MAG: sulfite exporter TauE/SafE family protein [Actinobacteria bacterium]|nr:sulfite exporter TauE/SafE family protein [Actinomycetota bacterium]